jgi:Subtilase family
LIDGVPVAQHSLLAGSLTINDLFDLEPNALVADRHHGTAMASLILHGDRNSSEQRLGRKLHVIPVLGNGDLFPDDRLIVDMIYQAILAMRDGNDPTAPGVLIVNLSLGNARKPFHGRMSAWARLIDRLSYKYGILFVISAGNHQSPFDVPEFGKFSEYQSSNNEQRAKGTMSAVGNLIAKRRLLSPSESVNGVTVGAANLDAVTSAHRISANVDPFPGLTTSNPSSALGPGFANSVKPDILMPGGKEHVNFVSTGSKLTIKPNGPSRAHGLKVAAPPRNGVESFEHYTSGTSAAAALASRTCHQIYDALEEAYGENFISLSHAQRATLLKALLVHTAVWPEDAAKLIKQILGPIDNRQHVRQKDNIRRFLGYGLVNSEAALACTDDRATFWASGTLLCDQAVTISVPIPICINAQEKHHTFKATLAWFTPVFSGRQSYRAVRLKLLDPSEISALNVDAVQTQPDQYQSRRGTVFSRRWESERAPVIGENHFVTMTVQREPDQGSVIDDPIPFALAITFAMPGVIQIYDQVRNRLTLPSKISI